jgi:hypothetical protein
VSERNAAYNVRCSVESDDDMRITTSEDAIMSLFVVEDWINPPSDLDPHFFLSRFHH